MQSVKINRTNSIKLEAFLKLWGCDCILLPRCDYQRFIFSFSYSIHCLNMEAPIAWNSQKNEWRLLTQVLKHLTIEARSQEPLMRESPMCYWSSNQRKGHQGDLTKVSKQREIIKWSASSSTLSCSVISNHW